MSRNERERRRRRRRLHVVPPRGARAPRRTRRRRRRPGRRHLAAGQPQCRVAARVPRPPAPQGRLRARTARGRSGTASRATISIVDVPEGTSSTIPTASSSPTSCITATAGSRRAAGQGGRGNARFLSNRRRAPQLRRAGRVRRGAVAAPRAQADGRRRARRVSQRGEVDADLGDQRGEAQDRRLSVHHARTAPRRGALA